MKVTHPMNCDIVTHALLVNKKFFFLDMMAESKENLKIKVQQFQNKSSSEFMVKWKHYPKK